MSSASLRLFAASIDGRGQPLLLKGEVQRGLIRKVDLSFDGMVGGVEGHLSDGYTHGNIVITNFRLIWVAVEEPGRVSTEAVPCHLPLGAVASSECKGSFLQLRAARIELDVRLDDRGYPSSDAMRVARVTRIKLILRTGGSADSLHNQLLAAMERRAWQAAPAGLIQEMHTPPPPRLTRPKSGPMTPQMHMLHQLTPPPSTSRSQALLQPPAAGAPDERLIGELQRMGFTRLRATNALLTTHNAGVQQAAAWLMDNEGSPLLLDRPNPYATAPRAAPRPPDPFFSAALLGAQGSKGGYGATQQAVGAAAVQPQQAQQQLEPRPASLGAGLVGILRREELKAAETDRDLDEAFTDLTQLMAKAGAMVALAESLRERMSRRRTAGPSSLDPPGSGGGMQADDEDEQMDEALAQDLADLGIASPVTRETAGKLYYQELSRQLAALLEGPVARAGGMVPLPEAYRLFNRARFTDLVSPDDLLQAVKLFPVVRAALVLREFPSGLKVVASAELEEDAMGRRVVELATQGSGAPLPPLLPGFAADTGDGEGREGDGAWKRALGAGVTRAEAAAALGVALPVAGEHLAAAEAKGLLCRDDGPEGLRYFKNFFPAAARSSGL